MKTQNRLSSRVHSNVEWRNQPLKSPLIWVPLNWQEIWVSSCNLP